MLCKPMFVNIVNISVVYITSWRAGFHDPSSICNRYFKFRFPFNTSEVDTMSIISYMFDDRKIVLKNVYQQMCLLPLTALIQIFFNLILDLMNYVYSCQTMFPFQHIIR